MMPHILFGRKMEAIAMNALWRKDETAKRSDLSQVR